MTRVDVVIAARNEAGMLGRCLEALQAQEGPAGLVRTIVVDNGSTDGTAEVAASRGCEVIVEPRPGAAIARNRGIAAGSGELIACLDAHCLVSPGWMTAMCAAFADPRVGGAQAATASRGLDPRVDALLAALPRYTNAGILDDTVLGRFNLYPWILSGNSMVRRDVVTRLGGYDERLVACEDVDLGWRIVLEGYQLVPVEEAVSVHWDPAPWGRFLRKGWRYGRGAAQVARSYSAHGARRTLRPRLTLRDGLPSAAAGLLYAAGHLAEGAALALRGTPWERQPVRPVREELRAPFPWDGQRSLRISTGVVFWFPGSDAIVVDVAARARYVLDGVGGFLWRQLADARSREEAIEATAARWAISPRTAAADVDDFLGELLAARLVESRLPGGQTSLGPYGRT